MRKTLIAAIAGVAATLALAAPGIAGSHDRNRDQIPDRWERHFHLSLKVDQSGRDQDRDGLDNMCEFEHGDSPRDADSDDDGAEDRQEAAEVECEPGDDDNDAGEDHRGPGDGSTVNDGSSGHDDDSSGQDGPGPSAERSS